jgi:hypothetical protein
VTGHRPPPAGQVSSVVEAELNGEFHNNFHQVFDSEISAVIHGRGVERD